MTDVLFHGLGKMGTAALRRVLEEPDLEVSYVYDKNPTYDPGFDLAKSRGIIIHSGDISLMFPETVDCVVDFTSEEGLLGLLEYGKFRRLVTGTTPVSKETLEKLWAHPKENDCVIIRASNFSPDVNYFMRGVRNINVSPEDHIAVSEWHRVEKAKASGTGKDICGFLCGTYKRPGFIMMLPTVQAFDPYGNKLEMPDRNDELAMERFLAKKAGEGYIFMGSGRFADEQGTHDVLIGDSGNKRVYTVNATRDSYAKGVVKAIKADITVPGFYHFDGDVI